MGLLEELAVRCEAATGASWVLNNEIWLIVGEELGEAWSAKNINAIKPSEVISGSTMASAFDRFPEDPGGIAFSWRVPDFTGSIDSAMILLADPYGYEQRRPSNGGKGACSATVWWIPNFPGKVHGVGQTPALALTAASLRARHALALKGSDT